MNVAEQNEVKTIADLSVNQYFDHYLTEVFPEQLRRFATAHNQDAEAHEPVFEVHKKTCPTKATVDRWKWMIAGGSAVIGAVVGAVASHAGAIFHALVGG